MLRTSLSVLNRSFRSRSSYIAVRAASTAEHAVEAPESIEHKLPSYLRNVIYQNRMQQLYSHGKEYKVQRKKKQKSGENRWDAGEDTNQILQKDINELIQSHRAKETNDESSTDVVTKANLPELFSELELTVSNVSSTGDGLALSEDGNHVYIVPFTVPGDRALVKIGSRMKNANHTITDLLKVVEPGPTRDDTQIKCQYFGTCSGCQLQMLTYEDQLQHKKKVVEKAYASYSGLIPELVPAIGDTFPSPLQYGYRTKLTPHFGISGRNRKAAPKKDPSEVPPIGFNIKNRRLNVDIEDCPLGTDIVRRGMKKERLRVAENIAEYKQGATILLRETTRRIPKSEFTPAVSAELDDPIYNTEHPDYVEEKQYVMDPNGYAVEYIDDYILGNKAGAFFQNNNSILSPFTEFMRQQVHPKELKEGEKPIKYLIDAYSGCGLFTVTLSKMFKSSLGIDIDQNSILNARENVKRNNLSNTGFAAADAALLFEKVPYPADETLLIIDPPRKGCSLDFLRQLLEFGPRRVAYVSCNVHTQARDVGYLVQGGSGNGVRYDIESIRGFDFFPQTGHVEGLAILNKAPSKNEIPVSTEPEPVVETEA
jgi:tRNA (uracil-5-)-methyltransferase